MFFLMIRRPPRSTRTDTRFPYTTLFRSLTRGAYEIGLSDLFILLDADQQALAERDALIVAKADQVLAQMQLYVALGGGWAIPAPQTLDRPPRIPSPAAFPMHGPFV